ncbi:F-box/LRR-repeat protein 15 isoform X1 [Dioscorea cayenensis subsp. rotundata]|uniref:F-box/LRR-repeat protein 15 isoform X1 n=1 Tax=Dioscorea cayennensis subsp. rotundata TaxID=55577 RepID=A0AB40BCB2_DIOCR|nr:F-box/LRR-repeat protein 15 isoform X1 [Dioscorea cayenensis subsp. rotundata]
MADERLKAVLDDGGSEEEVEEEEENVRLDLGLSLGSLVPVEGSSSRATRESKPMKDGGRSEWSSNWDLSIGSSRLGEKYGLWSGWQGEIEEAFDVEAEDNDLEDGNAFILEGAEFGRDFHHKRPKVLDYCFGGRYHATSSMGIESSALPPIADQIGLQSSTIPFENKAVLDLSPMQSDVGILKLSESGDGGEDGGSSGVRNGEDVDVRMDLSDDLLHLVFSFLGLKDLCKASATCKQWQAAAMHEDFWKCLNFDKTQISQQNFEAICLHYPKATLVNLVDVHDADVLVMDAMTNLRRLETLVLGGGQLGDSFFYALTDCSTLNCLRISDASLGNGMQEITVNHERLRDLRILKCRTLRISIKCPQLQTLSLRRTGMAHAFLTCPMLRELDISSCHKLSDAGIRSAATACHSLEQLDMSFCSCVSDETLREIAFACPNLSVLDASYCPNISLESVRLPMLTDLKLHNCEGITSSSMSSVAYSHMLKALQLDNCGLLTSVSLDLPYLQNISLVHCRKFVDLNLRSPVLSYIKVSNCSALHCINIISNALQKLVLPKQESLATLSLQCYQLLEVDLSDCESLTNSICDVFSDGGGCPMLKSLVLDNCESLTMVGLRSSSLVSLSLVGCRAMTVLELSCPNLKNVNLDGCDHLERASFCPVGLGSLNLGICPKLAILQIEAPKMSVLELKGCGVLSHASINCPCLTSLDASFCRRFRDDSLSATAASCPHIESLILSSCVAVGSDGLSSLHWLQYLTQLDLSYTFLMNLQPVFETCSQLEILKLSACKYLTDTSLDALYKGGALPALRELDLSYSSIGQLAISELLAACTNLVNLNLNGCANMVELLWGTSSSHSSDMLVSDCPANLEVMESDGESFRKPERLLEILNCTGCPNIKKVLIPPAAWCFHLSKLNLNLSTNLKEVDLACSNLSSLNLSNCSSLEILRLDCPRLANLQLLACGMLSEEALEAAVSRCNILETLNVHSCLKINAVYLVKLKVTCPSLKRIQSST